MTLWRCHWCTTRFAVGLPHCPQCGNADYSEDDGETMPKISRHGGPTNANVPVIVGTGGPELLVPAGDLVVPEAPAVISPYEGMSRSQLQAECEQRGLAKSGNKDELVARLVESDAA